MLVVACIALDASVALSVIWRYICTILRRRRSLLTGTTYIGMYVCATVLCVIVLPVATVRIVRSWCICYIVPIGLICRWCWWTPDTVCPVLGLGIWRSRCLVIGLIVTARGKSLLLISKRSSINDRIWLLGRRAWWRRKLCLWNRTVAGWWAIAR